MHAHAVCLGVRHVRVFAQLQKVVNYILPVTECCAHTLRP